MQPDSPRRAGPRMIRSLWIAFGALLGIVLAADFLVQHHAYFGIDGTPGFKAVLGFLAVVAMMVLARLVGALLQRPDDHYGE